MQMQCGTCTILLTTCHLPCKPRDDLSEDEAVALVAKGIRSGVFNDLGSGSNIDICVIRKDGVDYRRNLEFLQGKTYTRQHPVQFPPGTARASLSRLLRLCVGCWVWHLVRSLLAPPSYLLQC